MAIDATGGVNPRKGWTAEWMVWRIRQADGCVGDESVKAWRRRKWAINRPIVGGWVLAREWRVARMSDGLAVRTVFPSFAKAVAMIDLLELKAPGLADAKIDPETGAVSKRWREKLETLEEVE
jgi:hypothetical protein